MCFMTNKQKGIIAALEQCWPRYVIRYCGRETSEEAYNYLAKIPAEQWSVHAFDTFYKSEHTTNNVVEVFNGWLVKYRQYSTIQDRRPASR
ncbi:hypothetical protein ACOSQ4_003165 [Xanthoceras sorbifolium]